MYSTKFIKKVGRREGCKKEERQGEVGRGGKGGGRKRRGAGEASGHTQKTLNTGQDAVLSGQITVARPTPQSPDEGTCPARQEWEMKEQSGAQG